MVVGVLAAIVLPFVVPDLTSSSSVPSNESLSHLANICDCQQFVAARRKDYPTGLVRFSSKTGYTFDAEVTDESILGGCRAVQVNTIHV